MLGLILALVAYANEISFLFLHQQLKRTSILIMFKYVEIQMGFSYLCLYKIH